MKIFIANIPFRLGVQEVTQLFSLFGDVQNVKLIFDNITGKSKGYGFVQMDNNEQAQRAIKELNGTEINDRKLQVRSADGDAPAPKLHKRPRITQNRFYNSAV